MRTKTRLTALALLAAVALLGCTNRTTPQPQSPLRMADATIRIVFRDPFPKTCTIPIAESRGVDSNGEFYRGTVQSAATNDQNLVIVHWELIGNSSWGRGDVYCFDVGEGLPLDDKAQHLVLYAGAIQEVVDSDRVSITIGPKSVVEQPLPQVQK